MRKRWFSYLIYSEKKFSFNYEISGQIHVLILDILSTLCIPSLCNCPLKLKVMFIKNTDKTCIVQKIFFVELNKKSAFNRVKNFNQQFIMFKISWKTKILYFFFLRIQSNSEHISLNDIFCRKNLIISIRKNTSINLVWHDIDVNIIQSKSSLLSIYDVSLYSPRNNG